jgi:prepilin-type N-terminal cleavage/methylation domain-containing protein
VLQWFAGRVEEARDEHGFTVIELLVVVIIVGILAATACASTDQGSFATCNEETLTATFDWNQTTGVESEVVTFGPGRWVARSQHGQGGTSLPVRLRRRKGDPAGSQVLSQGARTSSGTGDSLR